MSLTQRQHDGSEARRESSQLSDSFGRISLNKTSITYVESAHWTAILDGVCNSIELLLTLS